MKKGRPLMEELVDLKDIKIDSNLSYEEKKLSFLRQIKNPNRFKIDNMIVNVTFSENGDTFEDKLIEYFKLNNDETLR